VTDGKHQSVLLYSKELAKNKTSLNGFNFVDYLFLHNHVLFANQRNKKNDFKLFKDKNSMKAA
jgi:hypothetical protein